MKLIKSAGFNFLLKKYKHRIYSYAYNLLKNKMDAEDATQEAFIRLWRNLDNINALAVRAWLYRTTHNLCVDAIRARNKKYEREFDLNESYFHRVDVNNKSAEPDFITQRRFENRSVQRAIDSLPGKYREVIIMYDIQGMKYKEISEILEIPLNSVKVNIFRARQKLYHELKRDGIRSDE